MSPAITCYRLARTLQCIKLDAPHSEKGVSSMLPAQSVVALVGPSQFFRTLEVRWGNEVFAIFDEDLDNWGVLIKSPQSRTSPGQQTMNSAWARALQSRNN